jgi:small-conductance mechanosensitive channel
VVALPALLDLAVTGLQATAATTQATTNASAAGPSETIQITLPRLVQAAVWLLLAYVVARGFSLTINRLADRLSVHRFRLTALVPIVKFLVYGGVAWSIIVLLFEFSSDQLLAFAGLLGAAIGLGLKDLLADVVGGMVVVLEQPYQVGDKVQLGDHYGEIVDIGIRSTKLVTPNDTAVVVPNFVFFNDSVANANDGQAEMLVVTEFYVAPDADLERATTIVEDALLTSQYAYVTDDHPIEVLVEDDLYYRTIEGKAYVTDLRKEYPFTSDVTERVLAAFADAGIESPTIPAGVDDGTPPE